MAIGKVAPNGTLNENGAFYSVQDVNTLLDNAACLFTVSSSFLMYKGAKMKLADVIGLLPKAMYLNYNNAYTAISEIATASGYESVNFGTVYFTPDASGYLKYTPGN